MVEALIALETVFAAVMVTYVFVHYMKLFFGTPKGAPVAAPAVELPVVEAPVVRTVETAE